MPASAIDHKNLLYNFSRIFWSIYFVIGIAIIGGIFGYIVTLSLFVLSHLLSPFSKLSTFIRHQAEYVQCLCIRMLLKLQPWLRCETNFPSIVGFYDQLGTRNVLFVANHRSNMDTFLLISYIPGLRGLAKKSLFYNIFFAPFMYVCGFIPVEKGSSESFVKGLGMLRDKLLKRNRPVLIFPENTRCEKNFSSVQKFSAAVFSIAIESKALLVPLVIESTDQLLGRGDLFIHPFTQVQIKMLEPIVAANYTDAQELRDHTWSLIHSELP